jgi:hypothetical protein
VARPRIWQPFETVKWASTYQLTDAGDIRDKHRNVLPIGVAPSYDISLRLYDTARKTTFPRRDILALEYFGPPQPKRCVICDKRLPVEVLHLNGNPRDFSRENLKYGTDLGGRDHELDCIRWAMTSNEVPPRVRTLIRAGSVCRVNSMPKQAEAAREEHNNDDE